MTYATVTGAGPTWTADGAADGWLAALAQLYAIPDDYRDAVVDRVAALDMLRCGEPVLDELIRAGLPVTERGGEQFFDRYDLFNLALASGSGTSVPERAIRYALRWMHGGPETWIQRLDWTFAIELACPLPDCQADPVWSHARLAPEAVAGELLDWQTVPAGSEISADRVHFTGPAPVGLSGRLVTRGELMTLRSPRLRAIVEGFLDADYTWVRMPERLQCEYERVMAAGVGPCISASLFLQREFQAAGYPALTRRGWLLGMLDLAHSWIEVVDDDGVRKVIDPIFARLVEHADQPHPDLASAVIGSRVNRLLPAAIPADGHMVTHRCGGQDRLPVRRTVIRRATA